MLELRRLSLSNDGNYKNNNHTKSHNGNNSDEDNDIDDIVKDYDNNIAEEGFSGRSYRHGLILRPDFKEYKTILDRNYAFAKPGSSRSSAQAEQEEKLWVKMITHSPLIVKETTNCSDIDKFETQCATYPSKVGKQGSVRLGCPDSKFVFKKVEMSGIMRFHSSNLDPSDLELFERMCSVQRELNRRFFLSPYVFGVDNRTLAPPPKSSADCWYCKGSLASDETKGKTTAATTATIRTPSIGMIIPRLDGDTFEKWLSVHLAKDQFIYLDNDNNDDDEEEYDDDDTVLLERKTNYKILASTVGIIIQMIGAIWLLYDYRAGSKNALYHNDPHPGNIMISDSKLSVTVPLLTSSHAIASTSIITPTIFTIQLRLGGALTRLVNPPNLAKLFDYGFMTEGIPLDGLYRPMSEDRRNQPPFLDIIFLFNSTCRNAPIFYKHVILPLGLDSYFNSSDRIGITPSLHTIDQLEVVLSKLSDFYNRHS